MSCSTGGLCLGSQALSLTVTTPPVITLHNNSYLSSLVSVKQGHSYAACSGSQQPTAGMLAATFVGCISWSLSHWCISHTVRLPVVSAQTRNEGFACVAVALIPEARCDFTTTAVESIAYTLDINTCTAQVTPSHKLHVKAPDVAASECVLLPLPYSRPVQAWGNSKQCLHPSCAD